MCAEGIQSVARDERLARHTGFWWGLTEGLFFFIVPDVYVSFASLFALRAGALAWLFSIAGSIAAVSVIYLLTAIMGLDYVRFLVWIPGISDGLIERVGQNLATDGLPYTPFLVGGGVPLKVYAGLAFSLGQSLGSVLVWTLYARLVRMAPTIALVASIRLRFHRRIDARPILWCVLLVSFWIVFYIVYFIRMGRA